MEKDKKLKREEGVGGRRKGGRERRGKRKKEGKI